MQRSLQFQPAGGDIAQSTCLKTTMGKDITSLFSIFSS